MKAHRTSLMVVVVLCASLYGCGVQAQDSAQTVETQDVPFGLLDEGTTTSTSEVALTEPDDVVEVCFLDDDGSLVPVLTTSPDDPSLRGIVAVLDEPPTATAFGTPLTTAVTADEVREVQRERGLAIVDLDPAFALMAAGDQLGAIAQLVCTLTAQPGIGQIRFSLDGQPIAVPRGDGSLTSEPVARADYAQLLTP